MAYNVTRSKLLEFTDTTEFERLCSTLLVSQFKRVIPLGGTGDQGRDAIEPSPFRGAYRSEDGGSIFQFSLQKTWRKKLNSELEKVFANGFKPSTYIFVTNREVGSDTRTKCQEEIKQKYGIDLQIFDVSWLQARLESPDYLPVRRQYLGLDETTLPAFIEPDEYAARRIDRQRAPDLPVFLGRDAEYGRVTKFVASEKRVLVLSAPPGIGKTKLLLEVARGIQFDGRVRFLRPEADSVERHLDELDPTNPLLLFIDDAHELEGLKQLIALILSPEFSDKIHVVVSTHPWAKERLNKEFTSRAVQCEGVDLGPLPNQAIDELIQQPQIGITDKAERRVVIRVSEGNPLVAIVAASLLKETGSLSGLTRHQVVMAHFTKALEAALPAQPGNDKAQLLLAIVSATKGVEYGNFRGKLAETLGLSEDILDGLAKKLEAINLLKRSWRGLRVIPDLLAEIIVFDAFFAAGHPFDFKEKVLTPFFASKGDKIFRSLAEAERFGASGAASIIDQYLSEARDLVRNADGFQREAILTWLKGFAGFRPEDTLVILRSMLESAPGVPTLVKSPVWGAVTITHADILRSASMILTETAWHCESCLRETLRLLYVIGAQQDHSRSNQDPWGDAIRVMTEQVVGIEPGKSQRIQEIALEEIQTWLKNEPSEAQLEIIIAALLTMFSVAWHVTDASPIDPRAFTMRSGLLRITKPLQDIRALVKASLAETYQISAPAQRLSLIRGLGTSLLPYSPSGLPAPLRRALGEDAVNIVSALAAHTSVDSIAERYELWKVIESLGRLGNQRLRALQTKLFTPELDEYAHLTEWPGHIKGQGTDWRAAEARHNTYWQQWASAVAGQDLDGELRLLNHFVQQTVAVGGQDSSATSINLSTLATALRAADPRLLLTALEKIESGFEHLQRFAGSFLGELFIADPKAGKAIMREWIGGNNATLRYEACRAINWVPSEQFGPIEVEQLHQLLALNDPLMDRMVVGYFGAILRKVDSRDTAGAVQMVKTVASRRDRVALNLIADALEPGGAITHIRAQDFSEIAMDFVDLDSHALDHSMERMLMRLFRLDPDAWLAFWEARIKREQAKTEGEHYWAVPFHLTAESDYVVTSPHRLKILGTFLEWSSRQNFTYQHNGATLLKLYSGNNSDTIRDVLEEWLASGKLIKLRAVAKVLKELEYGEFFLHMAKKLLAATDDDLVEAYLSDTIGSTGTVSGSFVPVYERRKADLEAWLADPEISLRAKVFARQQVARLARQIELHAKEDWDE